MSAAKLKIRGKITRQVVKHGKSLQEALESAANRYVSHAQRADNAYVGNLSEYLSYYIPEIEDYVLREMARIGPTYFEKSEAGRDARIQLAAAVATKNSELASQWRRTKRVKVLNKKIQNASQLKSYAPRGTTASKNDNIVRV